MKRSMVLGGGLLAGVMAMAHVIWLEPGYDFGLMKEQDGPRKGMVRFVNKGPEAVSVLETKPTCGCTEASGPADEVAPGDTAAITFTYDPAGRPGLFRKHIKVLFSDGSRQSIPIKGNVLGSPETLVLFYPVECGAFRLSDERLLAGNVTRGKTPSIFINAYNQSNDSVALRVRSSDKAIRVKVSEAKAAPGDLVTVGLFFESSSWPKDGQFEIPVQFTSAPDTPQEVSYIIKVNGTVIPSGRPAGPFVSGKDRR